MASPWYKPNKLTIGHVLRSGQTTEQRNGTARHKRIGRHSLRIMSALMVHVVIVAYLVQFYTVKFTSFWKATLYSLVASVCSRCHDNLMCHCYSE